MKFVVTAGPTREHIDPVRFLTNPSTGRMGFAVARAAVETGVARAKVDLDAYRADLARRNRERE